MFSYIVFFLLTIADICLLVIMVLDFQNSGSLPVCTKTQNSGSCEVYLRLRGVNLIINFYKWWAIPSILAHPKLNFHMFILVLEFNLPDFKLSAFWKA